MKRLTFTLENRIKTRAGTKTQTRRIGEPRYQVGDVVALCEPTEFRGVSADNTMALVSYPDDEVLLWCPISPSSLEKLEARKDPRKTAIARFMLDDFARHFCRVTAVKKERLQDISEEDAIAEGVEFEQYDNPPNPCDGTRAIHAFIALWNSINTAPARSWDANPIVTAYTYEYLGGDRP